MPRTDDEKLALALHRYRHWLEVMAAKDRELAALQVQISRTTEDMLIAHLEAREEQERLIDGGLRREQIETAGAIPPMAIDALALLKRVRAQ